MSKDTCESGQDCCICFEKTKNLVCNSGHVVCKECLKEIRSKKCPLCRQDMLISPEETKIIEKNIERERVLEIMRIKMRFVQTVISRFILKYNISQDSIPDVINIPLHYSESEVCTHTFDSIKRFALDENFQKKNDFGVTIRIHDHENIFTDRLF